MTVALVVPHQANMPSYNTVDLDEVSSMPSDFSYPQSSMTSNAPGMFSFSQTEPSADLLSGSSWVTTDGSQNLHDYPDNGSSHSGDAEEYIFISGQTTPKGSRLDQTQAMPVTWPSPRPAQAMSRVSSSHSHISAVSQTQMSNMSVRGNAHTFRNGPQTTGSMAGMDSCLLDSNANGVTSHMYWPDYTLDISLGADGVTFPVTDVSPLHVVPAQMHLAHDGLPSSPSTWDCFSSSISRTSSPATIDDSWQPAPFSPDSSPELACQSPRYVIHGALDDQSPYQFDFGSTDRKVSMMTEDIHNNAASQLDDTTTMSQPFGARRQGSEGESARDHILYKNVTPQSDGLFHCPWEGQANCNHKAEKLKCNYDKFVDSHLKPYRCKAEACEGARFSSTACLLRHEREAHGLHGHGDKPFLCMYEGCERSVPGSGFPRQWNLRDHMKRVHNDHGSAGVSPTSGAAQQPAKGRKRKSDASEQRGTTSRKASLKSMPVAEQKPVVKPLLEQWLDHRKEVEDILRQLNKPEDSRNIQQITEVQKRLTAMAKMASDVTVIPKAEILSGTTRRNFVAG